MGELATRPPDGLPVLGPVRSWEQDFTLIGILAGGLAPALLWIFPEAGVPISAAAALLGAISGPWFGRRLRTFLDQTRGRLPILALLALVPPLGALWGGLVAGGAGALVGLIAEGTAAAVVMGTLCGVAGALTGAVLIGLIWLPYAFQIVLRGKRWPLIAGVGILSPLLPVLAIFGAMLGLG
ncbi:MAG: hypothetical protein AAFV53_31520 [Myxococcota bacterium]